MEHLELRKYDVIWAGKNLFQVTGVSAEKVGQTMVIEMGIEKLPKKTVIFESQYL